MCTDGMNVRAAAEVHEADICGVAKGTQKPSIEDPVIIHRVYPAKANAIPSYEIPSHTIRGNQTRIIKNLPTETRAHTK